MIRYGSIYKITNKLDGKIYIGQTIKAVYYRYKKHCDGKRSNSYINNAIKKHAVENFSFEEILTCFDKQSLNYFENYFIIKYDTMYPNGYNLTSGGNNVTFTDEIKKKMSESKKGNTIRKDFINKVNSSGSSWIKKLEHAQRLGSETGNPEYNLLTSPRRPSTLYHSLKEEIIKVYKETNSSHKTALRLNLDRSVVCEYLRTWGVLNSRSVAHSVRNKNRYKLDPKFISEVLETYNHVKVITKVAKIHNINPKTVYRILKDENIVRTCK